MTEAPVLEYLKDQGEDSEDGFVILSTGYRVRIVPTGATIIDEVVARRQPPIVPTFLNEEKGREEENPNDPAYLAAMQTFTRNQGLAVTETMIMLGVELVDPVPQDEAWVNRLRFLEKRGHLDLSGYDFEEPLDRELAFKKYVVVGTKDLYVIGRAAGLNQTDIKEASAAFKS